jgi:hypothetical protein
MLEHGPIQPEPSVLHGIGDELRFTSLNAQQEVFVAEVERGERRT